MPAPQGQSGLEQVGYGALETTFDTSQTALNAFGYLDLEIDPFAEFHKSKEHLGSGGLQAEIPGKRGGKFVVSSYIKPSAVAPNDAFLRTAAMGTQAGTVWTLSATANSVQMCKTVGSTFAQWITGGWVTDLETDIAGNSEPIIKYSGEFASFGWLYGTVVTDSATHAAGISAIPLAAGNANKVGPGARVQFTGDTNSGNGYHVDSLSNGGLTMNISPPLVTGIAASVAVTPSVPAAAFVGTISGGVDAGMLIGGVSVGFTKYKMHLKTGIFGMDKEASTNRPNRLGRGPREVAGEVSFYFLDENVGFNGDAWNGTTRSFEFRAGPNTANSRTHFTTPATRLEVSKINLPGADVAMWDGKFMCRQSAAVFDEFVITQD